MEWTNGYPPPAVALFRTKEAVTPGNGFPEGRDFSKNTKDDRTSPTFRPLAVRARPRTLPLHGCDSGVGALLLHAKSVAEE